MILHTCFKHNQTLKPHDLADFKEIENLIASAESDSSRKYYQSMYDRIALGLITDSKTGKEYIKTFSKSVHVTNVPYIENLPLHFTMDFNVNPYMSGLVIQLEHEEGQWLGYDKWMNIRVFKEYALESPYNSAGAVADRFVQDFQDQLYEQTSFFLYGDSSGNNTLPTKAVKSLFQDFENNIPNGIYINKRVPKSNPRYKHMLGKGSLGRRELSNNIFGGSYPIRLMIDSSCHQLIQDLQLCQEDANGKLLKTVKNGVEERSHHLQALEYFYCHKDTFGKYSKVKL